MRDFEDATERVILGPERKSRIISEHERRVIAYHEAGHALVHHYLPKAHPVPQNYHCATWYGWWCYMDYARR